MLRRSLLKNLHAQLKIGVSLVANMTQSRYYILYIKVEQYFLYSCSILTPVREKNV